MMDWDGHMDEMAIGVLSIWVKFDIVIMSFNCMKYFKAKWHVGVLTLVEKLRLSLIDPRCAWF